MSHILKKQGKNHSTYTCAYTNTQTYVCVNSQMSSFDLISVELRALRQSFGKSSQFRTPYLKISLVFFIFQTRVFHNKLIQNPKKAKEKNKTKQEISV